MFLEINICQNRTFKVQNSKSGPNWGQIGKIMIKTEHWPKLVSGSVS